MSLFTDAELEELRRADAEIDNDPRELPEDLALSLALDRAAKYDRMDNAARKIAASQAAYREANKDKYNAYMRDYMRRRRRNKEARHGK